MYVHSWCVSIHSDSSLDYYSLSDWQNIFPSERMPSGLWRSSSALSGPQRGYTLRCVVLEALYPSTSISGAATALACLTVVTFDCWLTFLLCYTSSLAAGYSLPGCSRISSATKQGKGCCRSVHSHQKFFTHWAIASLFSEHYTNVVICLWTVEMVLFFSYHPDLAIKNNF